MTLTIRVGRKNWTHRRGTLLASQVPAVAAAKPIPTRPYKARRISRSISMPAGPRRHGCGDFPLLPFKRKAASRLRVLYPLHSMVERVYPFRVPVASAGRRTSSSSDRHLNTQILSLYSRPAGPPRHPLPADLLRATKGPKCSGIEQLIA